MVCFDCLWRFEFWVRIFRSCVWLLFWFCFVVLLRCLCFWFGFFYVIWFYVWVWLLNFGSCVFTGLPVGWCVWFIWLVDLCLCLLWLLLRFVSFGFLVYRWMYLLVRFVFVLFYCCLVILLFDLFCRLFLFVFLFYVLLFCV